MDRHLSDLVGRDVAMLIAIEVQGCPCCKMRLGGEKSGQRQTAQRDDLNGVDFSHFAHRVVKSHSYKSAAVNRRTPILSANQARMPYPLKTFVWRGNRATGRRSPFLSDALGSHIVDADLIAVSRVAPRPHALLQRIDDQGCIAPRSRFFGRLRRLSWKPGTAIQACAGKGARPGVVAGLEATNTAFVLHGGVIVALRAEPSSAGGGRGAVETPRCLYVRRRRSRRRRGTRPPSPPTRDPKAGRRRLRRSPTAPGSGRSACAKDGARSGPDRSRRDEPCRSA